MTASQPLDERMYIQPQILEWWYSGASNLPPPYHTNTPGELHPRLVHRYLSESPFFDHTSKNGLLFQQCGNDWELFRNVHDLNYMNDAVAKRPGVEYRVVGTPEQTKDGSSGVYVIRKLDRKQDRDARGGYPVTEVRGTYYTVGEQMFQAPAVYDAVGNRVLRAQVNLGKMMEKVKELAEFSPTAGHHYLPLKNKPAAAASTASTTGTPSRSREGSVAPGVDGASLRSSSLAPPESQVGGTDIATDREAQRWLKHSLEQTIIMGDEFMDENPIIGEPGNFKLTTSTRDVAIQKRKLQEAEAAALKAKELKLDTKVAGALKEEKARTPPAVFSEAKAGGGAGGKKESKEERKRRRKSRPAGSATSPTTPSSANPLSAAPAG